MAGPLSSSTEWRGFLKLSEVEEDKWTSSLLAPPAKRPRKMDEAEDRSGDFLTPFLAIASNQWDNNANNTNTNNNNNNQQHPPPPPDWQSFYEHIKTGLGGGILTSSQLKDDPNVLSLSMEGGEEEGYADLMMMTPESTRVFGSLKTSEGVMELGALKEESLESTIAAPPDSTSPGGPPPENYGPSSVPTPTPSLIPSATSVLPSLGPTSDLALPPTTATPTPDPSPNPTLTAPTPIPASASPSPSDSPSLVAPSSLPSSVPPSDPSDSPVLRRSARPSHPESFAPSRPQTRSSARLRGRARSPPYSPPSRAEPQAQQQYHHLQQQHPTQPHQHPQQQQQPTHNPSFYSQQPRWKVNRMGGKVLSGLFSDFNDSIKPYMTELRKKQKQTPISPKFSKTDAQALGKMHEKARQDIRNCLNECLKLLRTSILPPATIHEAGCLERDLNLELKQLELYEEELEKLKKKSPEAHCLASLVIAKQPFPKPIKKGTTVSGADGEHEEPTLVRLLTASKVCYTTESKVTAEVVSEDIKKGEEVFIAGERGLDEEGYATFYDLKFAKPTRLNVAHLYFHVQIRFLAGEEHYSTGASLTLRSNPSAPFVVITNESQWGDSEGMLMRLKAFYQETISWQYMANLIQTHFLRSTRQDVTKPERPLSLSDLNFLAKWRFENKNTITKEAYEDFWNWFGLACRRIRHQLPFHSLWMKGLILGLISRQDAERLLTGEGVGTFVIRFSETNPGKIVLSYVKKDEESGGGKVSHLLLAYGPREAPKHLQNILEKKIECTTVLKISTSFEPDSRAPMFVREPKESFFKDLMKKTGAPPLSADYEVDDAFAA